VRRSVRAALAGAAIALSCATLIACGGDSAPADQGIGVNASLQLADCDDWNKSSVEQRLATVKQLREFAGSPIGEVNARGRILDDDDAYDLLERYCSADFAGAFKLYKIYVRAAAFTGH
jgi:hypothetical protein